MKFILAPSVTFDKSEKLKTSRLFKQALYLNFITPILLFLMTFAGTYNLWFSLAAGILLYFSTMVAIIIAGLWSHLWLHIFSAGSEGVEQTMKIAFLAATPTLLFAWIPGLAPVFWLWSAALFVIGCSKAQKHPLPTIALALLVGWAVTWMAIAFLGLTFLQPIAIAAY